MNIVAEEQIKSFLRCSFMIKADLRDYSYTKKTARFCSDLWNIMEQMIEEYGKRKIIDKKIVQDLMIFDVAVLDCRYNIVKKRQDIENMAQQFVQYRNKILDDTYSIVEFEKDDEVLDTQYERILELEKKCWDYSCGDEGFICIYKDTGNFDFQKGNLFIEYYKEIVTLSNQIDVYTKNLVRIMCNVYSFFCEMIDELPTLGEIEKIYLDFCHAPVGN